MEILQTLLGLFLTIGVVIIFIIWVFIFIGLHNNTNDGNSFKLLNPLVLFDKEEFNEKGNKYRKTMLWIYLVGIVYALLANVASKYA